MIEVSKQQMDTAQYLIHQSSQGNHILFDLDLVRSVFSHTTAPMNPEEAKSVELHIEKLMSLGHYAKQKYFLEQLPELTLHRVIKTYFNIVENCLFETSKARH